MGRKKSKKKPKKVNAKRERYKKFHKEKSSSMDISMPDLSEEQMKQKREDEDRINRYMRYKPRIPPRLNIRDMKQKTRKK